MLLRLLRQLSRVICHASAVTRQLSCATPTAHLRLWRCYCRPRRCHRESGAVLEELALRLSGVVLCCARLYSRVVVGRVSSCSGPTVSGGRVCAPVLRAALAVALHGRTNDAPRCGK